AEELFAEIDRMGEGSMLEGVLAGIERGWFQGLIAEAAFDEQRRYESGSLTRVGVNRFVEEGEDPIETLVIGPEAERRQVALIRDVVRGDRPMHDPVSADRDAADLLHALGAEPRVPPAPGRLHAVVLACSDHRYQEPLRDLIAAEGLLGRSELLLWPGGSSAL